jgi:hypothetical protein
VVNGETVAPGATYPPDITAPTVTTVTPSGTGAAISGDIVITFDEAMDTGVAGTVQLNNSLPALTGGTWSAGNTVFTLAYSELTNSTAYTVNISGFKDAAGNAMTADNTHSFTTVPAVTGVESEASPILQVITVEEGFRITGIVTGETLSIYNVQGLLLHRSKATATEQRVPLPVRGLYIVVSGKRTVKAVY